MIRILFVLTILSFAVISCKKDYTCSCMQKSTTTAYVQYGTHYPQSTTASTFKNYYHDKEDNAKSFCKDYEDVSIETIGSGESQRTVTTTVECDLY